MRRLLKSRPGQRIVAVMKRHPGLRWFSYAYYVPAQWLWKTRAWVRSLLTTGGVINPHKTIWIDPADIVQAMRWDEKGYLKYDDRGRVMGGDWDLHVARFAETDVFRAFSDHFTRGVPWEATDYYRRLLRHVQERTYKRKMQDESDLMSRLGYLDQLYEKIRREGFRPNAELKEDHHPQAGGEDEVTVRIGRHGDLLFEDGRHRLAMAKLQNIRSIPAKVTVRHRDWVDFVLRVHAFVRGHGGRAPQAILHPDLADVPAETGQEGLDIIRRGLPPPPADVLVLGCGWGFHCTMIERLGYRCVGLEDDESHRLFLERLRAAHHASFDAPPGPILDYQPDRKFDAVLDPGLIQRALGSPEAKDRLKPFLGRLDPGKMILGCRTDHGLVPPGECVRFALEHARLSQAEHLGTEAGRLEIHLLT